MKSYVKQSVPETFEADVRAWAGKEIQLVLLFSSRRIIEEMALFDVIKANLPGTALLGCSTSGEIGRHVRDDTISLLGLSFEVSKFKCVCVDVQGGAGSKKAGVSMARDLYEDDLAGVFMLLPGVDINGSQFMLGMKQVLREGVSISGGLAGDGLDFQKTLLLFNDKVFEHYAVAFGVYGDHVRMESRSKGGWKPFGPLRRVTKADGNVLYELDGKSALDLYKEYLGDKAKDLPSSGLLYPFAIMDGRKSDAVGLIRTILNVDEDTGSLILAGEMAVGQQVCLMHGDTDDLVDGAEIAAREVLDSSFCGGAASAAICVSCVGRRILMGDDAEDELDAVREVFGDYIPLAGFHSYGEIGLFEDTGESELHNQTMTITFITEERS